MGESPLPSDLFDGVRVLDFTQVISGPYASFNMAMLGADVIKLELPDSGDQSRRMMSPSPEYTEAGMSAMFLAMNAGKRSLTLNLKHKRTKEVILRLVREVDVVIENFKAGTMARMGLDYDTLRAVNPKLVYCSISGYGQSGPKAGAAAYDPVVQAASGMMSINGYPETGPTKVGFWVVDMASGMNAAFAVASALFKRERTGEGQYLDVGMLDTALSLMSPLLSFYMNCDTRPGFTGNGTPGVGGPSTVYPTGDGFLVVAAATEPQFKAFTAAIGRPEMAEDERFATREARFAHGDEYRACLIEALAANQADVWVQKLADVGVPAGKIASIPEVLEDKQIQHRDAFQTLDAPRGLDHEVRAVRLGFRANQSAPRVSSSPPALGQHSDEVLLQAGFSSTEIDALRADGVL